MSTWSIILSPTGITGNILYVAKMNVPFNVVYRYICLVAYTGSTTTTTTTTVIDCSLAGGASYAP